MRLGDYRFEGIDEDGQTKFFHELVRGLFDPNKVPEADLRRYDLNVRSEEHTSELQSLMRISYAVFCLKKKKIETNNNYYTQISLNTNKLKHKINNKGRILKSQHHIT